MSANFGVNITVSAQAARPIAVQANTPIAIAGYEPALDNGLKFYMSVSDAIKDIEKEYATKKQSHEELKYGSIYKALKAIDMQNVKTQIIISVFEFTDNSDDSDEIATCVKALDEFKKAKSRFGYAPDLIIAPQYSGEDAVKAKIESLATGFKAFGIVDLKADEPSGAITKMGDFGTRRLIACYPKVKIYDEEMAEYTYAPLSSYIAGLIARTDGESEFGYSDSYSNRVIAGVVGTEVDVDFELGENCTADELRNHNITTVIRESGFRAWGGETSDIDTIWRDVARVRIFDRLSKAAQKGVLYAIDRKASELYHAKRSVEELLRGLVGAKVLLGFELAWSDKNSLANITAGKFYLDVKMQNNPIVKQLTLDFIYVDKFGDTLMDSLSK